MVGAAPKGRVGGSVDAREGGADSGKLGEGVGEEGEAREERVRGVSCSEETEVVGGSSDAAVAEKVGTFWEGVACYGGRAIEATPAEKAGKFCVGVGCRGVVCEERVGTASPRIRRKASSASS